MKKIISIFFAIVILSMLSFSVFAEGELPEVPEESAPAVEEEAPAEEPIPEEAAPTEIDPNVFSRAWEYFDENKATVFEFAFSSVILVILWIVKKTQAKLKNDISITNNNSSIVATSQDGINTVVNAMIEGYNAFKTDFAKMKDSEDQRDRQIAAMVITNTAILEIMSRVFPNSKNLPQGTKDLVNITYANAMKSITDDAMLESLVNAAKILLAAGTDKIASEEEAEVSA